MTVRITSQFYWLGELAYTQCRVQTSNGCRRLSSSSVTRRICNAAHQGAARSGRASRVTSR